MTKITKAEFETLPDSLKSKFKAEGEDYILDEPSEDLEGLKRSKAEILAEKKRIQEENEALKKFKAEHEAELAKAQEADLEAKGKYEEAIAAKEKAWKERFDSAESEKNSLFENVKRERLENELVKRGALAERASYLVGELDAVTELVKGDDGKYTLKKKGGIGDADEFNSMIEAAKNDQKTAFFFAPNGASGSGASGSQGGGSAAKTWNRSQWDAASDMDRTAFSQAGGQVKD